MLKTKVVALVSAMSVALSMGVSTYAARANTDVNVALGKSIKSSVYGTSGPFGTVVGNAVDGSSSTVYISCAGRGKADVLTIDLGKLYTVSELCIGTYGNDDPADSFSMYSSTFDVKLKAKKDDEGVSATRRMNGESGYFSVTGGGYKCYFDTTASARYRYVEVTYVKGQDAPSDLRITELEVYAPSAEANSAPVEVSVGKTCTVGKAATWGKTENLNDGSTSTNFFAYGASDGQAWVLMDLGMPYPIEKVTADIAVGGLSDVMVSNSSDFSEAEYLYEEDGEWFVDSSAEVSEFRYVKFIPTVAPANASDTTPSTNYLELTVYSTQEAKDSNSSLVNVALNKSAKTNKGATYGSISAVNDGNEDSYFMVYTSSANGYIQLDLGHCYDVKQVSTRIASKWGWGGAGKVIDIQVSNDPNFAAYKSLTKVGATAPSDDRSGTLEHKGDWCLTQSNKFYRYVRVCMTPGYESTVGQYKLDTTSKSAWTIGEITVLAPEAQSTLQNVALNRGGNLIGSSAFYGDFTASTLVDGKASTITAATGLYAIALDYPVEISQIDVDFPGDRTVSKGFDVWLSKDGTITNAVKVMNYTDMGSTVAAYDKAIKVNSTEKYAYVVFGIDWNFWVAGDVQVLTNDVITEAEYSTTFDDTTVADEATVTYTMSFRSPDAVSTTVAPIIARYDNGVLTDVTVGEAVSIDGKYGEVSLPYTVSGATDANTTIKAFIWNPTTQNPFLNAITK